MVGSADIRRISVEELANEATNQSAPFSICHNFVEHHLPRPQHAADVGVAKLALLPEMHVLLQFGDGGCTGSLRYLLQFGKRAEEAIAAVYADILHYCSPSRTTTVVGAIPAVKDATSAPARFAITTVPAET